jgi:hypothetical protein
LIPWNLALYLKTISTLVTAPGDQLKHRDRLRAYMQAFNPTGPARAAIEAGLVFEDLQRFLFRKLAARADLEQGSQQLLVGGVGSGKTTELLLAARWLEGQGTALPLYIDITAETDLSGLNRCALLASFGMHLALRLFAEFHVCTGNNERTKRLREIYDKVNTYAYGKQVKRWVDPLSVSSARSTTRPRHLRLPYKREHSG